MAQKTGIRFLPWAAVCVAAAVALAGCESDAEKQAGSTPPGHVAAGVPDALFGQLGSFTHGFNTAGSVDDVFYGVTEDNQGRILATGVFATATSDPGNMGLMRLRTNGTLDTSFNGTGYVTYDGGSATLWDVGYAVKVDNSLSQPRYVVAGRMFSNTEQDEFTVWRFTANGAFDTSFAGSGTNILVNLGGANDIDVAFDLAMDVNGAIIVGGLSLTPGSIPSAVVTELQANGNFDPTFNGGSPWFITAGVYQDFGGILRDHLGNVVTVGSESCGGTTCATVRRYLPSGLVDTSFNGGSYQFSDALVQGATPSPDYRFKIVEDKNFNLVIAGTVDVVGPPTHHDAVVYRLLSNGVPDTSFGGTGTVRLAGPVALQDDNAYDLAIDAAGNIVVVGETGNGSDLDMMIWRLLPNGQLDNSFANIAPAPGGYIIIPSNVGDDGFTSVYIQPDGGIVAAGYTSANGGQGKNLAIWRFY